ncbi:MAG: hypothetical protein QGI60_01195, partial [archaeon]|nr:hypothetical protein [archaeon]
IFEKFKPGDINLVFDGSTITCLPVIRDLLLAPHPKTILGEFSVALNKKGIATSNLENKELEKELPIKEMLVSGPNSINTFFEFKIGLRASSLIVNKKKFKSIHGIG